MFKRMITILLGVTTLAALAVAEDAAPKAEAAKEAPVSKSVNVLIKTSLGDIKVKLDGEKAPISTENFLKYVDKKFYDGTIFHRVINGFMIQGGGFDKDMNQKPVDAPIKNESGNGLTNKRGSICMARTNVLDSATSQFYINVVDNFNLDQMKYASFGEVIEGMDVVDKIKAVPVKNAGPHQNVPATPVMIESVTRIP